MTELEHQIMRFEDRWWRLAGSKDATIQRELGMKPTRYYQVLHQLVGRQDVHAGPRMSVLRCSCCLWAEQSGCPRRSFPSCMGSASLPSVGTSRQFLMRVSWTARQLLHNAKMLPLNRETTVATIKAYSTQSGRRYRVRYRKPGGQQTDKRGFATKSAAELWAANNTVNLATGNWLNPADANITVGQLGADWYAQQTRLKPSSLKPVRIAWELRVQPRWADVPVGEVRHSDVQTWVSTLQKLNRAGAETGEPLAATGVIYAHQVLDGILAMAVKDRRIPANPADDIDLPRKKRKPTTYLTHQQLHALADVDPHYRTLVLTLGYLGARWGEATALEVRHLNPLRRRLNVVNNLVQVDGKLHAGDPKGGRSRTLPIPNFLLPLIIEQCKDKAPNDPLFTGRDGDLLRRPPTQRGWFQQAIKTAGVPRLTPHDLRHTAASLAVQSGANVKAVQRMLGHTSAAMTLDIYADLFDDDLDALAERLDSVVGKMWAEGSE